MTQANPTPKYVPDFLHNYRPSKDVIVVGQSPSKATKPKANGTFAILNAMMIMAGVYSYSFMNVIEEEGGNKISQVDFDSVLKKISPWIGNGKKIIAMGDVASDVLTRLGIAHLKIEHPSGSNRNLNNFEVKLDQPRLIHEYVKGKK